MRYWVFTSKPAHFKLEEALVPGETLDWPTFSRFKFEVGDLVFIYASSPVMQLVGKLEIECNKLDFSQVNPHNELRKWPRLYSNIPWLRLRVLQRAPIPFKPLQHRSLYYHTEFKPSPYPKLLHDNEIDYVLRAFDEAKEYNYQTQDDTGTISDAALSRTTGSQILREYADFLDKSEIDNIVYSRKNDSIDVTLELKDKSDTRLSLAFTGIERSIWTHDTFEGEMQRLSLKVEDTFLLARFEGSELEILARDLTVSKTGLNNEPKPDR